MSFLKGLSRQDSGPTSAEMRNVLSAMQRERAGLEGLVQRAESAANELRAAQSGDAVTMAASLGERIAALETQLRAVEALAPALDRAANRLSTFDESWERSE